MSAGKIKALFFDLGDTLVRRVSVTPTRFDWIPGAEALVKRLRLSNLPLGLISNTGSLTRQQLLAMMPGGFQFDLFQAEMIVLSSEVSIEKPDPRIFRLAISRAQNSANAAIQLQLDAEKRMSDGQT